LANQPYPTLRVRPITLRAANAFVREHHRRQKQSRGCRFCLGLYADGRLAGVAIVGRTKARGLQNDLSAEIVRVATDGTPNACSALYGRCRRVWEAMGGDVSQLYTYIEGDEPGTSLIAAGFQLAMKLRPRAGWDCKSRRRENTANPARTRWVAA
jgi:hypothetical protein